MIFSRSIVAACTLAGLVGATGCRQDSEIIINISTDLSPPVGFTRLEVGIFEVIGSGNEKEDKLNNNLLYSVAESPLIPGADAQSIHFPATIALVTPANPDKTYRIKMRAKSNDLDENNEQKIIATDMKLVAPPPEGVSTVRFSLDFLCDIQICKDMNEPGSSSGSCCEGENVCRPGGECSPPKTELTVAYDTKKIFGGGLGDGGGDCFDAVGCFDGHDFKKPMLTTIKNVKVCTLDVEDPRTVKNVGLVTKTHGACGINGCYVPLDPELWSEVADDKIKLPMKACTWLQEKEFNPKGEITGVIATTNEDKHCPKKKTVELPICGPASSSGGDTQYSIVLAKKQDHPVAMAADEKTGNVYWANEGMFNTSSLAFQHSSVMRHRAFDNLEKNQTLTSGLAAPSSSFRDVAISNGQTVFWTDGGEGTITCMDGIEDTANPMILVKGRHQPEGIAAAGSTVVWTQLDGSVWSADAGSCKTPVSIADITPLQEPMPGSRPFRVVTSGKDTCWTDQKGTLGCTGNLSTISEVLSNLSGGTFPAPITPRGFKVFFENGNAAFAAFAAFQSGVVYVLDLTQQSISALPESFFVENQNHPSGVAVDRDHIYWTNWGDGTVKRVSRHGCISHPPPEELLAIGQNHPSAITVTTYAIYWANEGSVGLDDGSVVVRAKPPVRKAAPNACAADLP